MTAIDLGEVGDGGAGADEVAVAEDVVDAGDGGPVFGLADVGEGEGGGFAGVGVGPVGGGDFVGGVGGVFEGVVFGVGGAGFGGFDFGADGGHGVTEAVEFGFGFAFGGFDHEGAADGPGHGGGVVAVVHEAFGDVFDGDVFEVAEVEDALVGDEAVGALIEGGEVGGEAFGDVVGVEDGEAGGFDDVGSHHGEVHPGDGQDAGAAPGGAADGAGGAAFEQSVAGEEGGKVLGDADGTDAGTATAVGDAEGFVEVEVADVGADATGGGEAELGVEVGAIHVNLAAVFVGESADFGDGFLEHAVGRGVGDHEGGEIGGMLIEAGAEVVEVDVAVVVTGDGDDLETDHDGAGGVGAVGGGGDEADVAVALTVGVVIGADGEEAGEFALGAGVGLERDGVEAGAFGEPGFELGEEGAVALGLRGGGEGVEGVDVGPAEGEHFSGGVEFHGAGAEGDHAAVQGDVFVLEVAEVAHHGGLRVMGIEDRVGQYLRLAMEVGGAGEGGGFAEDGEVGGSWDIEGCQDVEELDGSDAFVEGDDDPGGALSAEVEAIVEGFEDDRVGGRDVDGEGVEEGVGKRGETGEGELFGEPGGGAVGAAGDGFEALGAVKDGVHGGHDGEEDLGGADVAGGFLAPDVLFAGLEGEAEGGATVGVVGDTDEAAGEAAFEGVSYCHEGRVRAAEAEGDTEALAVADADVGAEFAWSFEHGEGEEIGGDDEESAGLVGFAGD